MKTIALALLCCAASYADCPTGTTQVTNLQANPDGSAFTGRLVAFLGYTTPTNLENRVTINVVNGVMTATNNGGLVCLAPGNYSVQHFVGSSTLSYTTYWVVPAGVPVTVAAIETTTTVLPKIVVITGNPTPGQVPIATGPVSAVWGSATSGVGLGTAASQPISAFDPAGAAAAAQAAAIAASDPLGSAATALAAANGAVSTGLQKSANLSDLPNAGVARTNLGLGSSAVQPSSSYDVAGAAAAAQAAAIGASDTAGAAGMAQTNAIAASLQKSANLSDLNNAATARTNLGLGSSAVLPSSTFEPAIAFGSASQYYRGDKTYQTLSAAIWGNLSATSPLFFDASTGIFSCPTCGAGSVASVFGRAGTVTAQTGDYTTAQVSESGNLYFTSARAQSALSGLYELPLTFGAGLSRSVNTITVATGGVTNAMLAGSIAASKLVGSDISITSGQVTGLPTFPLGTIVGTTDTQALTGKTLDGVSPSTMAFLDATSSIQAQLNSKQASLGYTALNASSNLSDVANSTTARTNLGLGSAATQSTSAFEVPLTFSSGLSRTSNTITIPALGVVDSMIATGITPSKVGNGTAQWNANQINGVTMSGLATGLIKNTTTTGAPSIASSSDVIAAFDPVSCTGSVLLSADGHCYAPTGGANQTISHTFTGTQELAYTHNLNTLNPVVTCFADASPYAGLVDGVDYHRNATTPATLNITYITASSITVDCSFNNSGAIGGVGPSGSSPPGTGVVLDVSGTASAVTISGDGTINPSTGVMAVTKVNGVSLAGLATGIAKITTSTGAFSTAIAADFPTLNQSTTGNASTATALAVNPADCASNQYANAIAANGDLTCAQVAYTQVSGTPTLPTFPSGTIVGTSDTQTLTAKTIDGVTPTTMAFVDATSSIQTQLNAKQASLGFTPLNAASNLSDLGNAATARTNLGLDTAATQPSSAFEVPLTIGAGLNRATNTITIPTNGVTNAMLAGSIAASKLVGTDISITSSQVTGLPTFPSGAIIGTTDSQTMSNKTVDGVSPTTMSFVDPTSSVQTQLNGKQSALGFTPLNPSNNLSELTSASTARSNLGLGTAATSNAAAFEVPLTFGSGLNRVSSTIIIPALGVTNAMLNGSIAFSKLIGSDISLPSSQITGLPIFPTGAIIGTTDTQTLSNKTLDGVAPSTMAFLDATSSIQGQLNAKIGLGLNTFTRTQTMAVNTVASGATPAFDLSQGNIQYVSALATNASPTFSNITTGGSWTFVICTNSTGNYTWTWPAAVHGGMTIDLAGSKCNVQEFVSPDGTNVYAKSYGVVRE